MGSLSLLQAIFPTQGSKPGLLQCGQILYQLSHKGSPRILESVAYPFSSGSSWPRNRTRVSCIASGFFTNWAIREAHLPLRWGFPKSSLPSFLFPPFYSLEISLLLRSSPLGEGFLNSLHPCLPAPVPDLCFQFTELIDPRGYLGGPSNLATWTPLVSNLVKSRHWASNGSDLSCPGPGQSQRDSRGQSTRPDSGELSSCPIGRGLRGRLAQLPIGRKSEKLWFWLSLAWQTVSSMMEVMTTEPWVCFCEELIKQEEASPSYLGP